MDHTHSILSTFPANTDRSHRTESKEQSKLNAEMTEFDITFWLPQGNLSEREVVNKVQTLVDEDVHHTPAHELFAFTYRYDSTQTKTLRIDANIAIDSWRVHKMSLLHLGVILDTTCFLSVTLSEVDLASLEHCTNTLRRSIFNKSSLVYGTVTAL